MVKKIATTIFMATILSLWFVSMLPVGVQGNGSTTHTVVGDGAWGFTLAEMNQHFSHFSDVIDASEDILLTGSVTLGNFEAGAGNDVWYEIGLVSEATYFGYPSLNNKGVYMIAFWDIEDVEPYYKVHIQNVKGYDPFVTGNYLDDDDEYVDLWDDAGSSWFKVPSATFDYELKYHDVVADNGLVDLRISVDDGITWSGWKLYKYAEDDMEKSPYYTAEEAVAYGCADDDDLTDARVISQLFVCSGTTEEFTATYDNIQVNGESCKLVPRVLNFNSQEGYADIQVAIDAAEPNNVIHVYAGTYGNITINQSLTVKSVSGAEVTIIDAVGADRAVNILSNLGEVTFEGFTVYGFTEQGICHRYDQREGTTVHVLNNIVPVQGVVEAHGNSIQVSGDGSTVIGNNVSSYNLDSEEWTATAILVVAADNAVVRNNYVHHAQLGISVSGLEAWGGPAINNIIENNTVVNGVWGIAAQMDAQDTAIRYNTVLNNSDTGIDSMAIDVSWAQVTPSGTEIHYNNIVGNENYGVVSSVYGSFIGEVSAETVNATLNWWGTVYSSEVASMVSENVEFTPWLGAPYPEGGPVETTTEDILTGTRTIDATAETGIAVDYDAVGDTTVTVTRLDKCPEGEPLFSTIGEYVDVYIPDAENTLTSVTIRVYYEDADIVAPLVESELRLYYWSDPVWIVCSYSGVNTIDNYIWATLNSSSAPQLDYLETSGFGGGTPVISLAPETGFTTTVAGDGFSPDTEMTIMWNDVKLDTIPLVVETGGSGEFTAAISAWTSIPGTYTINATDGVVSATATFTVPIWQGEQGEEGEKGDKGDTGATGPAGVAEITKAEIEALNQTLHQLIAELDVTLEGLMSETQTMATYLDSITATLDGVTGDMGVLEGVIDGIQERMDALETFETQVLEQFNTIELEIEDFADYTEEQRNLIRSQITALEGDIEAFVNTEILKLDEQREALEEAVLTELTKLQLSIEELEASIQEGENRQVVLETELSDVQRKLEVSEPRELIYGLLVAAIVASVTAIALALKPRK